MPDSAVIEAPAEPVEAAPEAAPVIAYQAEPDAADLLWGEPEPESEPVAPAAPETDGGDPAEVPAPASGDEGEPTADAPASASEPVVIRLSATGEDVDVTGMSPAEIARIVKLDGVARDFQSRADRAEAQAKRGEAPAKTAAPQPEPADPRREKASAYIAAQIRAIRDTDGVSEEEAEAIVREGMGSLLDLHRENVTSTALTPVQAAALARIEAEEAHRALVAEVAAEAPQILKAYGVADVTPAAFADALARMEAVRPQVEREAGRRLKDYEVHETALTLARDAAKRPEPVTPKNSPEPKPAAPIASKGVIPPAPKPRFPLPSRPVTPGRPDAPRDAGGRFTPEEPDAASLLFG